jgi:hypothetical protein
MYYQNLLIFKRNRQKTNQLGWVTKEKIFAIKIENCQIIYDDTCFQLLFYAYPSQLNQGFHHFLGFVNVNKIKQKEFYL